MLKAVEVESPAMAIQRYAALDGLRGVAAYLVVISHYLGSANPGSRYPGQEIFGYFTLAGQVGVMLFFVISGFLMGELYMQTPFNKESVRAFYVKRIARVVPLYYLIVLASFALLLTRGGVWPLYYVDPLWHFMLFWHGGDNVLWTVPVEVQFYALFPLIWWAFSKYGNAATLLLLIVGAVIPTGWITAPALFHFYFPYFAAGLLLSVVTIPYSRLVEFLIIPAFMALMLAMPDLAKAMGFRPTGLWGSPVYLVLAPTAVLLVINSRWAAIILGSRPAAFAGMISYSVYLLHMPVHFVFRQLPIYVTSPLLFICVALVGTTAVAWLSFRLLENPARRLISKAARTPSANGILAADHHRQGTVGDVDGSRGSPRYGLAEQDVGATAAD
ncbi:acyltransferase [Mesorhizobium loti]|uniref:Acyltransferase n=1 Tax=Mesorhizobium jarvisii TaxID=1777867 RepID=A0A6M7TID2_9HYPH|nr:MULTISPECIES: acyltransferase [Mesorhizobium]QKC64694.1 acyltransferase [Mesorhizobium jarvisii]QKD10608.1 acyltransferase [Mesorhizobium loti]RJT30598.1 acyltransferase [Mesorhizobium jarvisii]